MCDADHLPIFLAHDPDVRSQLAMSPIVKDFCALLNMVQGYDYAGYDRTIDTQIKNLRKKLQTFGLEAAISSVYRVGYRFQIPN